MRLYSKDLFACLVQACTPAISLLRYFYEDYPDLHLIAAGSLLEFALESLSSFGVGRIRSMFIYPFCFKEFLIANQGNRTKIICHNYSIFTS